MANTKERFEVEVSVDADNAVRELERLRASTERVGKAAKEQLTPAQQEAAKAQSEAAEAAKANAEQLTKNLGAAAALGGAVTQLSSQLGPMGAALGSAASSAGALYAAMGPVGAVIGGITGALPGIISGIIDLSNAHRRAAESQAVWTRRVVEARTRLNELTSAISESRARADQFRNTLQRGFFDAADTARLDVELSATQRRIATLTEQANTARLRGNVREQVRAEGQIAALEGRVNVLSLALEEARAKEEAQGNAGKFERAPRATPEVDAMEEELKIKRDQIEAERVESELLSTLNAKKVEALRLAREQLQAQLEMADAMERAVVAKENQVLRMENEQEEQRILARAEAEKTKAQINAERERAQELADNQERFNNIVSKTQAGLTGVVDIFKRAREVQKETESSFGKAFKTALDEWLKSFALQEAYKGVAATAEAIGSAVTNPANAGAKFAEAGIHFALAAVAGGASAAIPNAGGGGGGGGRGGRPEPVGGGSSSSGGGTVVVNFNAPVSDAEIGRQQERASRAARRRFGS